MALIANGLQFSSNPGRFRSGVAAFNSDGMNGLVPATRRNFWAGYATVIAGVSIANKSSFPSGYRHPGAWLLAPKAGGISSRLVDGEGDITFTNLAGGLNAAADLAGAGDIIFAAVALIVAVLADLSGTATLTADMFGKLEAAADLAGDGDLVCAMSALAGLVADLDGEADLVAAFTAFASMSANITVTGSTLTTANVGDAVWNAIAEAGLSFKDVQRILLAVAAGKTEIDVGPVIVKFRDQADTKDRVVAEMSGSERIDVTLDPS